LINKSYLPFFIAANAKLSDTLQIARSDGFVLIAPALRNTQSHPYERLTQLTPSKNTNLQTP